MRVPRPRMSCRVYRPVADQDVVARAQSAEKRMRARRELRRKQERAIAALQFANGKLACAGQRRTKAAVVARRIALLARFVRNNCGAPADGHVDHPGLVGGRTAETRKPGLDLQVLAVLQVLHCFFLIDFLFGLAGENDTRCCSYGPSRCESFRRPPSRSGSNRLRPSHQNHLRCVRLIKIGRTSGRRRIKAHLLVRSTDRPALTASHQVWPIALTAIEARGGPNMLRVRSQRGHHECSAAWASRAQFVSNETDRVENAPSSGNNVRSGFSR